MIPPNKKRYEEYLTDFVPEIITKQKHLADIKMYLNEIEILEEEFVKEFNLVSDLTQEITRLENLLKSRTPRSNSTWDWESMTDA